MRGFDRQHVIKTQRQRQGEQSNSGVEIERGTAFVLANGDMREFLYEKPIGLKERARAHAEIVIANPVSQLAVADGVALLAMHGGERRELAGVVVRSRAGENYDTLNRRHNFMQRCCERLTLSCVRAGTYIKLHQHLLVVVIGEELNAMRSGSYDALLAERPQGAYRIVDQRRTDGTLFYSENLVRSGAVISELKCRRGLDTHPSAIAIVPRLSRMYLDLAL